MRIAGLAVLALLLGGCAAVEPSAAIHEDGQVWGSDLRTYRLVVRVAPDDWPAMPPSRVDVRDADTSERFVRVFDSAESYRFVGRTGLVETHAAWGPETPIPPLLLASINLTKGTFSWDDEWIPLLAPRSGDASEWGFILDGSQWKVQRQQQGTLVEISASNEKQQSLSLEVDMAAGLPTWAEFVEDQVTQWHMTLAEGSELIRGSMFLKDTHAWKLVEISGDATGGDPVDADSESVMLGPRTRLYGAAALQCETEPSDLWPTRLIGTKIGYFADGERLGSWACSPTLMQMTGYKLMCPPSVPREVGVEMDPGALPVHSMRYQASILAVEHDLLEFVKNGGGWRVQEREPLPDPGC